MIEKVCDKIIGILITKNFILEDDKELYIYALKITIQSVLNVFAVVITGVLLGMLKESIMMFISFFVLRKFIGGLHLDKYIYCFISSQMIHLVGLLLVKKQWLIENEVFIIILLLSVILILLIAPVTHPNKSISSKERRVFKGISIISALLLSSVSILTIIDLDFLWVGYSIGTSLVISSLLMCIGEIILFFKKSKPYCKGYTTM